MNQTNIKNSSQNKKKDENEDKMETWQNYLFFWTDIHSICIFPLLFLNHKNSSFPPSILGSLVPNLCQNAKDIARKLISEF